MGGGGRGAKKLGGGLDSKVKFRGRGRISDAPNFTRTELERASIHTPTPGNPASLNLTPSKQTLHGSLCLVDLAGSERVSKSDVTGECLKETQVHTANHASVRISTHHVGAISINTCRPACVPNTVAVTSRRPRYCQSLHQSQHLHPSCVTIRLHPS